MAALADQVTGLKWTFHVLSPYINLVHGLYERKKGLSNTAWGKSRLPPCGYKKGPQGPLRLLLFWLYGSWLSNLCCLLGAFVRQLFELAAQAHPYLLLVVDKHLTVWH